MSIRTRPRNAIIFGLFAAGLQACSQVVSEDTVAGQDAELGFDPYNLRSAKRQTLVDGIVAAENQTFTSTGRLFVSGDDGIYEIARDPSGLYTRHTVHAGEDCAFGGMVERAGTLYANCYDFKDSKLFAAPLTAAPEFRPIYLLKGTTLANGLTTDGGENLFVASTFDGKILRLHFAPEDPLTVQTLTSFDPASGAFTNGIKYFDHKLYWTSFTTIYAADVRADSTSGPKRSLGSAVTVLDDLFVDETGILVADYINGSVAASDLNGKVRSATPNGTLQGPSSVLPTLGRLGLPDDALLVTERSGNRLALLRP